MLKVLDSAVPVACWSCSVAHNDATLFCPHCSKIQPPPGGDYFIFLGLERGFQNDLAHHESELYRLSRKLHPDRFARAEENEKQWSLADTALLNDAYRTLKDPIHRTEYLLKLEGAEIGEARFGISRRRHHARDPALHHAGAQSRLHGRHAGQASCGHRRSASGDGDRGA